MNAASPASKTISVGQAAKFFRVLGIDSDDVKKVIDDPDYRDRIRQAFGIRPTYQPFDIRGVEYGAANDVINELCSRSALSRYAGQAFLGDTTLFEELLHSISPFRQHVIFSVIHPKTGVRRSYEQAGALLGVPEHRVRANFYAALSDMARVAATLVNR